MRRNFRDSGYDEDTREDLRWNTLWREAERIAAGDEPDAVRLARSGWTVDDARTHAAQLVEDRRRAAEQKAARDAYLASQCPTCHGEGCIPREYYDRDAGWRVARDTCPVCDGTGRKEVEA